MSQTLSSLWQPESCMSVRTPITQDDYPKQHSGQNKIPGHFAQAQEQENHSGLVGTVVFTKPRTKQCEEGIQQMFTRSVQMILEWFNNDNVHKNFYWVLCQLKNRSNHWQEMRWGSWQKATKQTQRSANLSDCHNTVHINHFFNLVTQICLNVLSIITQLQWWSERGPSVTGVTDTVITALWAADS